MREIARPDTHGDACMYVSYRSVRDCDNRELRLDVEARAEEAAETVRRARVVEVAALRRTEDPTESTDVSIVSTTSSRVRARHGRRVLCERRRRERERHDGDNQKPVSHEYVYDLMWLLLLLPFSHSFCSSPPLLRCVQAKFIQGTRVRHCSMR